MNVVTQTESKFEANAHRLVKALEERETAGLCRLLWPEEVAKLANITRDLSSFRTEESLASCESIISRIGGIRNANLKDDPESLSEIGITLHEMLDGLYQLPTQANTERLAVVLDQKVAFVSEKYDTLSEYFVHSR